MGNGTSRCVWISAVAGFVLVAVGCQSTQLKEQISDQERMIRQLRREKTGVEGQLNGANSELARLRDALDGEKGRSKSLAGEVDRLKSQKVVASPPSILDRQRSELSRALSGTEGRVDVRDGDLVVTLPSRVTFDSGSANVSNRGSSLLRKIKGVLQKDFQNNVISIEGHTDSDPVRKSRYGNNWRLSVERAMAVRKYLEESGIAADNFRVVGYGAHRPVASNRSTDGKQQNRRVEIVIVTS